MTFNLSLKHCVVVFNWLLWHVPFQTAQPWNYRSEYAALNKMSTWGRRVCKWRQSSELCNPQPWLLLLLLKQLYILCIWNSAVIQEHLSRFWSSCLLETIEVYPVWETLCLERHIALLQVNCNSLTLNDRCHVKWLCIYLFFFLQECIFYW